MSSFSPLMCILKENKLTGPNYVDWKRNLDIVLTAEEYKFVLDTPCPENPNDNSTELEIQEFIDWNKANDMAKCYILASMSNVLQHQHQAMATAYDMIWNLKSMFGDQNRAARQVAMRAIMNSQMAEGTPVRDHVLKMMGHLNELEILGANIDEETQIDIVLLSLPESFKHFRMTYSMSKMKYSLAELLRELVAAEGVVKKPVDALNTEQVSTSQAKRKRKFKKVQKKGAQAESAQKKQVVKKPKGYCFQCGEKGHWKTKCPVFLNKVKQGNFYSLIVECLAVRSTGTWCVDSGATNHICNSLQGFQETRKLSDGEIQLHMGDDTIVGASAVGDVQLSFGLNSLVLKDCLYVPSMRRNLISVSKLRTSGYRVKFYDNVVIKFGKHFICSGTLFNDLYFVAPDLPTSHVLELNNHTSSRKRKTPPHMNQTWLWHLRLGHINLDRIHRLVKDGPLGSLKVEALPVCESCIEGKMSRNSFKKKGQRVTGPLELVHSDLCGPMNVEARGKYEYYITFIDDYSRYGFVYLIRHKSEAFEKFKEYRMEAEKRLGKNLLTLRSDRGGEYLDGNFRQYLLDNGITSQLTAPGTPQQNGVAERRNRTLLNMVRSMLSYSTLPPSFWGYALETANYVLNLVPSKAVSSTPTELWTGHKPSLRHIRIWGSPAHVLNPDAAKLEPRSEVCLFVGYPRGTKGGLYYSPKDRKVFVSAHARFLEEDYIIEHKPTSRIVLEEMRGDPPTPRPKPSVVPVVTEEDTQTPVTNTDTNTPVEPRRSGRVIVRPARYALLGESSDSLPDEQGTDPRSYDEALQDTDAALWQTAMESEIGSMYSNQVWDLVDPPPEGVKPIGCKWIYKRKRGVDGKVETFKARLVAKWFTQ